MVEVLFILSVFSLGGVVYFAWTLQKLKKSISKQKIDTQQNDSHRIDKAQKIIQKKLSEAKAEAGNVRRQAQQMLDQAKNKTQEQVNEFAKKNKILLKDKKDLEEKKQNLELMSKKTNLLQKELIKKRDNLLETITKTANLTKDEAQQLMKKEVDETIKSYKVRKIKESEEQIKAKSDELAKEILIGAMQSAATEYVGETSVSSVQLPNEDAKGRIIGKEGRNVRTFEKLTGVDVIIDETPNTIGISSFDAVRRAIASKALESLIKDGRIHPGNIEQHIKKAKQNMSIQLRKDGKFMADEAGWHDAPEEILVILGRQKYRYSVGQNLYRHVLEVMRLAEYIAMSLKADVKMVKIAAIMHDVGKLFTHKIKKPHHHISGEIARKHGLDKKTVNVIEAHHGDIEPESLEAVILQLADAVSGARPGARKENYGDYVERLEALEKKVYEIVGDKAEEIYALRAGREMRVIVKPDRVDDNEAVLLAREIAQKIEESGIFPGNVQVMVIREMRAVAETH